MKGQKIQRNGPRETRQQRSRYKVRLILEASMRLLKRNGIDALTTNAIAASAGKSIERENAPPSK
jgi:AcrR family transcriptional regulator